ncbi:hypothetical protein 16Q_143c [Pseudomonas phage 16Q]|nr:hypothetical protein 16Q_143c [Pseudomonas phage 16Q]
MKRAGQPLRLPALKIIQPQPTHPKPTFLDARSVGQPLAYVLAF